MTYETQRDRLRCELDEIEAALPDDDGEEAEIESVLSFAAGVVTNSVQLWKPSALDKRQCLQQALFPTGLSFDGQQFGNIGMCLAFKALGTESAEKSGMASPTGFAIGCTRPARDLAARPSRGALTGLQPKRSAFIRGCPCLSVFFRGWLLDERRGRTFNGNNDPCWSVFFRG